MTTLTRHARRLIVRGGRVGALLIAGAILLPGRGVAGPLYWDMPAGRPFADCSLQGMKITSDGFLAPGLPRGRGRDLGVDLVWTMVPDGKGGYYLGTGHDGLILALDRDDSLTTLADLDCDEILSLAVLPDGRLLAGCEPDGRVFMVETGGKVTDLGETPGGYVWAMTPGPDGRVYLAVGSPAALMVLDPDQDRLERLTGFPAENALAVAFDAQGKILVATQGPGLVYRLDPAAPGSKTVILQADQNEVSSLVRGPNGLCALALDDGSEDGESPSPPAPGDKRPMPPRPVVMLPGPAADRKAKVPRSALYDLEDGLVPTLIWSGNLDLMCVMQVPDLGWVAGGLLDEDQPLTVLYRLTPPAGHETLTSWRGGDVMALQGGDDPGTIRVVQTHPSRVDDFGTAGDAPYRVLGPILDAERPVNWGHLSWSGAATGGKPAWSVRTGNRETADETWTDWSPPWSEQDKRLKVPSSRFLQWRLVLPRRVSPDFKLTGVTVSAWGENRRPVVTDLRRENLKGVRKGGLMARNPNLTRTFDSGLKAEFNRQEKSARPGPAERAQLGGSVKVFSWKATDPDGDRLDYELACRRQGREDWTVIADGRDGGLEAWDTSTVPDGIYEIRLKISDSPDNPGAQALSSQRLLAPVVVDNTPPRIRDLRATGDGRSLKLEFEVEDAGSQVAGAFLVLPDGGRERLDPRDRICDSAAETFNCRREFTAPDTLSPWVRIEVIDTAGNLAEGKCRVQEKR